MRASREIDPGHGAKRGLLRVLGPIVLLVGLGFVAVGMVSFFAAFGSFGPPKHFWCAFVGMPILFVGGAMTAYGYMGAMARYQAQELAPVGKDAFNYLAKGTSGGLKSAASAVASGLAEGMGAQRDEGVRCSACGAVNDADANFCDECGAPLSTTKECPACQALNDSGAKFCDNCGAGLT